MRAPAERANAMFKVALYESEEFKVGFFLGVPIWDHYPLP